jgi:hypothetical protein
MRQVCKGLALVAACVSTVSLAGPYDEADRLFATRDGGSPAVAQARAAYKAALTGRTGEDLVYGVQQVGRLAVYEGQYLLGADNQNKARKAEIYQDCRATAELLRDDAAHRTEHAYWRTACTSLWMKFASVLDRLSELPRVKADFNELVGPDLEVKAELGIDQRYQSGGLERVLAAIYANSLSSMIRDTLPNPAKSLEMADRALSESPFPGDSASGADYYRNHRQRADSLVALARAAEARSFLADAIAEIDERATDGDLPVGLETETLAVRDELHRLHDGLSP